MNNSDPVHVVGLGIVSAIGLNTTEHFDSFRNGKSGIGFSHFLKSIHSQTLPVGEVKLSNKELSKNSIHHRNWPRTALLSLMAAQEAIANAEMNFEDLRIAFISATTVGGMDLTERASNVILKPGQYGKISQVRNHSCGSISNLVAKELGINSLITTVNTACSSSVNSIIFGARLIKHNLADVVIAGGADALTTFTLNGFNSLMILDKELCRPLDATRNGLNLGEGAAYLVLTSTNILEQKKKKSKATITGYSNTNDAHHQTASSPDGIGSFSAMQGALNMACLKVSEIDYLNAHGTGTQNNDLSECTAIRKLFGDNIPALSSTKAFTGHTLGASGALESAFSVLSLEHQFLLPNLRFAEPIDGPSIIPQTEFKENAILKNVMSNSFGFGGNCSSIIFSKA